MADSISEVAHRPAENAEAVCRHDLQIGRREGRDWLVGMSTQPRPCMMLQPIDRITLT